MRDKVFHTKVILKSGDVLSITNMFSRSFKQNSNVVEVACYNYLEDLEVFNEYSFGYWSTEDKKWHHWSKRFSGINPQWTLGKECAECIEVFEDVPIDTLSTFLALRLEKVISHILPNSGAIFNSVFNLNTSLN